MPSPHNYAAQRAASSTGPEVTRREPTKPASAQFLPLLGTSDFWLSECKLKASHKRHCEGCRLLHAGHWRAKQKRLLPIKEVRRQLPMILTTMPQPQHLRYFGNTSKAFPQGWHRKRSPPAVSLDEALFDLCPGHL